MNIVRPLHPSRHYRRRFGTSIFAAALVLVPLTLALSLIFAAVPAAVAATTVDLSAQGSFTTPGPFSLGGLTITGSNTLAFVGGSGLGIVGGFSGNAYIDPGEFATFTFAAGPATGVFFSAQGVYSTGGVFNIGVEGFDAGGASLGVQPVNVFAASPGPLNVSALFGDVPLSAFSVRGSTSPSAGAKATTVTFTVAPEPGTLALVGTGLLPLTGVAGAVARRRRILSRH